MMASKADSPGEARKYLKPQEVAELLGKSLDWVRRRAADNTLPHRFVGRDLRFIASEIDAWVNGNTREKH